jgi:hypothetical protein
MHVANQIILISSIFCSEDVKMPNNIFIKDYDAYVSSYYENLPKCNNTLEYNYIRDYDIINFEYEKIKTILEY